MKSIWNFITGVKKPIVSQFPQKPDEGGFYQTIYKDNAPCCPNCGNTIFSMGPEGGGCVNGPVVGLRD